MMKFLSPLAIVLVAVTLFGCAKNDDAEVQISMIDAPTALTAINIDIAAIEVYNNPKAEKFDSGWNAIETEAGVYNILDYQNGNKAAISSSTTIKSGRISQIKLILGGNNSVEADGAGFGLALAANASTEIVIDCDVEIEAGSTTELLIDFDGEESVSGSNVTGYELDPVVRFVSATSVDSN